MGPLAVLLPVIALMAAILPSSAMAALNATTISGSVSSSGNSNPLSGVTVTAIDTSTPANDQTATTDGNGHYSLSGLTSTHDYYLSFSSHGSTWYYDETKVDDVTTDQATAMADVGSDTTLDNGSGFANPVYFSLPGLNASSINGTLFNNDTNQAMSGVTVTAIDATTPANGGQTYTTDSNGNYTLSGLTSGDSYYFSFASSGYVTQYYDENSYDGLTASASQAADDAPKNDPYLDYYGIAGDSYLMSGGAVNGTLSLPAGINPTDGQVRVYTPGGNDYYGNADANGDYSVPGIPGGSPYVVEFQPYTSSVDYVWYGGSSGAPSFSESLATPVSVTSGQVTSGVDFSAPATAKVTGVVSGPGGPLQGIVVELLDASGNYAGSYASTNASGQFTLDNRLDPGTYYLEAYDNNSSDDLAPGFSGVFTVSAGGTVTENITMSAGGTITGTVSGPTGSELTGSEVYVTAVNGTYTRGNIPVSSSGTYTLHGLPAGSYYVEWQPADSSYPYAWYDGSSLVSLEQDAQAITVSNGQTATANFSIPQAGEIQGTVTDAALNQPAEGVRVEVLDSRGDNVHYDYTSIDGGYAVTGLLPGSYKVEFLPEAGATVAGDPAPDLAFQYYTDASSFATASTVTVAAGQTAGGINAALGAGGTVSGRVTDAATGAGVPGDEVELLTATGQPVDSGWTNSDGTYTVYGVAPGSYYVEFDPISIGAGETVAQFYGGKPTLEGATMVTVSAGQAVENINAVLALLTAYVAPPVVTPPPVVNTPAAPAQVTPVVHLLSHSGLVKGDRLGVRLSCSGAACRGSVKVTTSEVVYVKHGKKRVRKHRTVTIGTARYSASAGQAKTLMVKLNAAGRRALAKAKTHHLAVTITATVSGGKKASRHERIWTATKHKKK